MGTTGMLSWQYRNISTLLRKVNRSVTLLKIRHYQLAGFEAIKEEELLEARQFLADVLSKMIDHSNSNPFKNLGEVTASLSEASYFTFANIKYRAAPFSETNEYAQFPQHITKHARKKQKEASKATVAKLQSFHALLLEDQPLSEELIHCLDDLCLDLDAQATKMYQNLRRM
jgi:hypothetical protein